MTKEQRADTLLEAARLFQNYWAPGKGGPSVDTEECRPIFSAVGHFGTESPIGWPDFWASAALSEVAGMGFALVNSDGTPTEKVDCKLRLVAQKGAKR